MKKSTNTQELGQYLNIAQVQEKTTLSRATIVRYIKSGRLPASQVERKIIIKESDVVKFLSDNSAI